MVTTTVLLGLPGTAAGCGDDRSDLEKTGQSARDAIQDCLDSGKSLRDC